MNKDIDNDDSAQCKGTLLRWAISWCPRDFLGRGSRQKCVANLWTEFAALGSKVLAMNGKELQKPNKLVVAATCEVAKT